MGVVADTHVGEALPRLPAEVLEALDGVDLVLHAGDLSERSVLRELEALAPVVAVRGNHDRGVEGYLPREVIVHVGAARIALTHGMRARPAETASVLLTIATGRLRPLGLAAGMRRRLGPVEAIVFGHLHTPFCARRDGTLVWSPGAVYVPESDPGFDWDRLTGRAYRRFRRSLPREALEPRVGILEVRGCEVRARSVPLARPIRTYRG